MWVELHKSELDHLKGRARTASQIGCLTQLSLFMLLSVWLCHVTKA